jgi:hypothetical protein
MTRKAKPVVCRGISVSVCVVCVAEVGRQAVLGMPAKVPVMPEFKWSSVTALRKGSAVELA